MRKASFIAFFVYSLLLIVGCASYQLEKKLDPESKEFFSKVRYIISNQERKIFLNIAPAERKAFIEEFWKRRDPNPDTEINEFKEQYFRRIEEANHLFKEGTSPGWLQDRGRIYITLGPPDNREVYPRGITFYGLPTEIWYYGFFQVIFIDESWTGEYKLEPLSANYLTEINKSQVGWKPKIAAEEAVFDFNLTIKKLQEGEALFQIEVPYKDIWLAEKENTLQTTLEVSMEVFDQAEKKVWQHQKSCQISLAKDKLKELVGKNYVIEVSAEIGQGSYILVAEVENKTEGKRARRRAEFTI